MPSEKSQKCKARIALQAAVNAKSHENGKKSAFRLAVNCNRCNFATVSSIKHYMNNYSVSFSFYFYYFAGTGQSGTLYA